MLKDIIAHIEAALGGIPQAHAANDADLLKKHIETIQGAANDLKTIDDSEDEQSANAPNASDLGESNAPATPAAGTQDPAPGAPAQSAEQKAGDA